VVKDTTKASQITVAWCCQKKQYKPCSTSCTNNQGKSCKIVIWNNCLRSRTRLLWRCNLQRRYRFRIPSNNKGGIEKFYASNNQKI
jgi:hypothetical protein